MKQDISLIYKKERGIIFIINSLSIIRLIILYIEQQDS